MSLLEEARAVRQRIEARLRELEPLVREYNELKQVAAEMGLETPTAAPAEAPTGAPAGRAQGRTPTSGAVRRRNAPARRRPRPAAERATATEGGSAPTRAAAATGQIAERVLDAVQAEPGRTVAEYAEILGVSATALYRPVRELTNDGVLVKRARQLFPA